MALNNRTVGFLGAALSLASTGVGVNYLEACKEESVLSVMGDKKVEDLRAEYKRICEAAFTEEILDGGRVTRALDRLEDKQVQVYLSEGRKDQAEEWDCLPGFTAIGGIPKFE
ncbi:MAG: hypothetical protein AAB802_05120 [Patescibacteria group bacterium]